MSVGVLVTTYDGYADIWPIAAELFKRFWPDRPWPMYWMTNKQPVPDMAQPIVRPVIERQQWGLNLAEAVESMPHPFILMWVEEELLLSPVPNDLFLEAAEILRTTPDVGIVQLTRYYAQPEQATVGHFTDWPLGFAAALPAIFRKGVLLHLLKASPQSNDFEQQSGKVLQRDLPSVRTLMPCAPMFRFCDNALLAGPWRQCAVKHLKELGFQIDYSRRGISPDACSLMDGAPA